VHIKDVSAADAKGTTVEVGRGVIDIPKLLKSLVKIGYSKTVHFEHEKDAKDPFPGLAESVGYVRGVLASI
jgi:sugar phosphate isomerase/epimerase